MLTDSEFEQLVGEAIERIPKRFLSRLENVAIVTARKPTPTQLQENHLSRGETLLGLYEGIPLTRRGDFYGTGMVLPDKITIFKDPIEAAARGNTERLSTIVRDTVWHEIAHYFGYDDDEIDKREAEGTNHPPLS